jgi:hypothetical protein
MRLYRRHAGLSTEIMENYWQQHNGSPSKILAIEDGPAVREIFAPCPSSLILFHVRRTFL